MPEISGAAKDEGRGEREPVSDPKPEASKARTASRDDVAIEAWINGSGLDQNVASQLRPIIFGAVADAIDWDMLGLAKASFVGKTRAFQTNSISFERQTTQVRQDLQVKIQIPGDLVKPTAAGVALQGLPTCGQATISVGF